MDKPSRNIASLQELLQKKTGTPQERTQLGEWAFSFAVTFLFILGFCSPLLLLLSKDTAWVLDEYAFLSIISGVAIGVLAPMLFARTARRLRLSIWGREWQAEYDQYQNALTKVFETASEELYAEKQDILYTLRHELLKYLGDKEKERLSKFCAEYKLQLLARREKFIGQLEQLAEENEDLLVYCLSKRESPCGHTGVGGGLGSGIYYPSSTELKFSIKTVESF